MGIWFILAGVACQFWQLCPLCGFFLDRFVEQGRKTRRFGQTLYFLLSPDAFSFLARPHVRKTTKFG